MVDNLTPEKRSKIMSSIRGKDTKIELLLRKALWKEGIRGYKVSMKIPGRPDIVFPKYKIAIFCDGDFWHGYNFDEWKNRLTTYWFNKIKTNIERDKKNDNKLLAEGWTILHFWEWEILKNVEKCKQIIVDMLFEKGYKK
ncbi:MAG: very short patch repair endonuclease [Gammaproteobacteria bacterium]|nr:very short patch repair endonuclease [Gammaproteobacteria bacterium]